MIKKIFEYYKAWRHDKRRALAQWYANLIIKQMDHSRSEKEFGHLLSQGINLDALMVYKYNIYLD